MKEKILIPLITFSLLLLVVGCDSKTNTDSDKKGSITFKLNGEQKNYAVLECFTDYETAYSGSWDSSNNHEGVEIQLTSAVTSGSTYTQVSPSFAFYWDYIDGEPSNEQNYSTNTSAFTLTIVSWDTSSGRATGTFSGTLDKGLGSLGDTITISDGEFSTCIE